jgi:DNA-binding beta-propeller fold protein YncE
MFIPAFFAHRRFVRSMLALAGWACTSSLAPAAEEVRVELTTWIGRANLGSEEGAAARLCGPSGVALDASGNLYIADTGNSTVRLRTSSGTVTTLAGLAGTMGTLDGIGAAARFSTPQHLATDGAGNLYVLDLLARSVRKITPAGVVTTLRVAELCPTLNAPSGIAVSSDGQTLYLSDRGNHVVRRLAVASSTLTVLAGDERFAGSADGTGTAARFYDPSGLALDGAGNLYVADARNHTIRRITPAGVVTTLAGTAGESGTTDGTGVAARFYMPKALALDGAGNLYIADAGNHTVRRLVLATGAVSTWAASPRRRARRMASVPWPGSISPRRWPRRPTARSTWPMRATPLSAGSPPTAA